MAVVVKWLTHQIVALTFGGSIPLGRPIFLFKRMWFSGKTWPCHGQVEGSIPFIRSKLTFIRHLDVVETPLW